MLLALGEVLHLHLRRGRVLGGAWEILQICRGQVPLASLDLLLRVHEEAALGLEASLSLNLLLESLAALGAHASVRAHEPIQRYSLLILLPLVFLTLVLILVVAPPRCIFLELLDHLISFVIVSR